MNDGQAKRKRTASGRRRPTQADVAARAEVSAAIVSAVVNSREHGTIRISDRTRERVWDAVRELGYVPNIAARNLASGRNRLLGVFTFQSAFPLESRDFYYEFLVGIEEAAEEAGYNLLMFTGTKTPSGARSIYPDGINCLQLADGAVLVGVDESREEITRLADEGYPFVFVGQRDIPGVDLSYTAADYVGGTANIVRELVRQGHRRIALIQNAQAHEPIAGRRAGFRLAREELGLTPEQAPILTIGESARPGKDELTDLTTLLDIIRTRRLTALVIELSTDAPRIRAAARRAGITVPDRLSLVALGGSPEQPGMATIAEMHIPRREMGREAVRLLLQLLDDPTAAPVHTTLECNLRAGRTLTAAHSD
ncbi:LacI family DNA-binding transcriptional regulator [Amycolatopsis sp. NPDC049253]|uniref:LacI family DNA-binding transcriptional regulator n=1 Tax=Amycolatopsis sp. NPDC049253 TaxID=3155274 RepID=UPI003429E3AB